jgi:hypothetical protein
VCAGYMKLPSLSSASESFFFRASGVKRESYDQASAWALRWRASSSSAFFCERASVEDGRGDEPKSANARRSALTFSLAEIRFFRSISFWRATRSCSWSTSLSTLIVRQQDGRLDLVGGRRVTFVLLRRLTIAFCRSTTKTFLTSLSLWNETCPTSISPVLWRFDAGV